MLVPEHRRDLVVVVAVERRELLAHLLALGAERARDLRSSLLGPVDPWGGDAQNRSYLHVSEFS